MSTPMKPQVPRRRESDHPKRRMTDSASHRRLLMLVTIGVVVGAITLMIAINEARYARVARIEDILDVRERTEEIAEIEQRTAEDVRQQRIRTENLFRRQCELLAVTHEEISSVDCLPRLLHPEDPVHPADQPSEE